MAGNQIRTIGAEIGTLRRLLTLNLSSNQISVLPKGIYHIYSIYITTEIPLTNIEQEIGNLARLRQLHLSSNVLTSLPTSINQLSHLQQLEVTPTVTISY